MDFAIPEIAHSGKTALFPCFYNPSCVKVPSSLECCDFFAQGVRGDPGQPGPAGYQGSKVSKSHLRMPSGFINDLCRSFKRAVSASF